LSDGEGWFEVRPLYNRELCFSSRQNLINLRSLLEVNDENLANFNEVIKQRYHYEEVS